jgi:hypothetical protein
MVTSAISPERTDGRRYPAYSAVIEDLAAPAVFKNRSTYRLVAADLRGAKPRLDFARGTYFDGVDVSEAVAHEYAATMLVAGSTNPMRNAVGNPCDPDRRPVNIAISCLTLRYHSRSGQASFPLHWRDPTKVGHAGGLFQVMPVGVFQASSDRPWDESNDFDLWRCLMREFAEELLGASEDYGNGDRAIDYEAWPFAARMTAAKQAGDVRVHCLGLGVDPLTFATDLLVVLVAEASVYDEIFGQAVNTNAEGRLLSAAEGADPAGRIPFVEASVGHYSGEVPMQAAGAAVLRLAWRYREVLLEWGDRHR